MALRPFSFDVVTLDEQGRQTKRRRGRAQQFVERLGKRAILEMVQIPGGTFTMGAPENEPGSRGSERPQHRVSVPPFYLGKHAVTIDQWRAVMGARPHAMKIADDSFKLSGRQPVVRVSFDEAEAFCARLSRRIRPRVPPAERGRVGIRVPRRDERRFCVRDHDLAQGGKP